MGPTNRGRKASYTQPDWMAAVKVGDVLRDAKGNFRVVRSVSRWGPADCFLHCITFAIRKCSKYRRGYTILNASDLRTRGFAPTGVHLALGTELDFQLEVDIYTAGSGPRDTRFVDCCIAKDMP